MSLRPRRSRSVHDRTYVPPAAGKRRLSRLTVIERVPLGLVDRWRVRLELAWHRILEWRTRRRIAKAQRAAAALPAYGSKAWAELVAERMSLDSGDSDPSHVHFHDHDGHRHAHRHVHDGHVGVHAHAHSTMESPDGI